VAQPTTEVMLSAETTEPATYRERQWVPLWVSALLFTGFFLFGLIIFGLLDVFDPNRELSYAGEVAIAAGSGVFVVLCVLYSTLIRVITVQNGTLKITRSGSASLTPNVTATVVRGADVRKLRSNMNIAFSPGGVLAPAGQLGSAVAGASVGVSAIKGALRGGGMVAAFWMHEAVLVHTPDNLGTELWLIGTRYPDELAAAIRSQIADPSGD
jgi:prepilin signal peptidase PulO-like enzyme (type II secretory pathway)